MTNRFQGTHADGTFRKRRNELKPPAACFHRQASILAAENAAAALKSPLKDVSHVIVEISGAKEPAVSKLASGVGGGGHHWWNPQPRENADHSTPYPVAATLMDGTVTQHSFE